MQDFKGILFTLKKRMQNASKDDNDKYDYLTFGYYDGLDIKCIDKWYDYRPKGLIDKDLALKIDDEFIDLYTIKALFPKNVEELEGLGFFYMQFMNGEENKFPFMAMSLINVSEQFVDRYPEYENLNKTVYGYVKECLGRIDGTVLKCAVFPAIGYADYIIVYFSSMFSAIAAVTDRLRKKKLDGDYAAFSGCYTVCGFNTACESVRVMPEEDVKLSIRINLKSGKSSEEFIENFKSRANALLRSEGLDDEKIAWVQRDWERYFHTFDNSDGIFIPEGELGLYLPFYMKGNLLNPGSEFFKSYITNIQSSVRVKGEGITKILSFEEENADISKKQRIENYWEEFTNFIAEFHEFIENNNLHRRNVKSLEHLMKNFLNLAQLPHCFDVERIMGQIFTALIQNLRYAMQQYFNEDEEIDLFYVIESLNQFREIVSVYMTDMIHSDKLFIEGQTLTHQSVGSATKLLFAYNSILLDLMNAMRASEKDEAVSEFKILVTSGGCDRTNVRDIFSCLGNHAECPKILVATIPEISLYDIKGTMFRLFHECMHFCGKRHRKERLGYLIAAIGKFVSNNMMVLLYNEESFELYFSEISIYFSKDDARLEQARSEIYEIYQQNSQKFCQNICRLIVNDDYFSEYISKTTDELSYYFCNLEKTLLNQQEIAKMFLSDLSKEDTLGNKMYRCLSDCQMEFFKEMSSYAKKHNIFYTGFDSYIQHKQYLCSKGRMESEIECFLNEYLQEFMQRFSDGSPSQISNAEDIIKCDELIETLSGAFKEGFADCFAIKALNMDCIDFLLAFIYEEWDIELALPDYLLNIMRIGADLSVMYNIKQNLSSDQKTQIFERVKQWENQGYKYQNVRLLVDRVNSILESYSELETCGLTEELEEYLRLCIQDKDFPDCSELSEFYRTCDFYSETDHIYQMMGYLTYKWEGLSYGDRAVTIR